MAHNIHLIGNAHIDIFWLWRWEEGLQEIRATFASALDRIGENGEFIFTSACAYYYSLVEETDPLLFKRIHDAVKTGRWRITGGWWLQPDCNAPSGESNARQALYAQRYFREKFGVTADVGYNVDSFGHNGNLPQILKKSGLEGYVFMRPGDGEKSLPAPLFIWEGIDGTRVRAFRLLDFYGTGGDEGEGLVRKIKNHILTAEKYGTPLMCFYGVGNHGGGPTKQNLMSIDGQKSVNKSVIYSDPHLYFKDVSSISDKDIPVVKDELQFHAIGCYSALSKVKKANNNAEQRLLFAEKMLCVIGNADETENHKALAEGWKKVLANQFHDSLGGCSIPEAYVKILAAYSWAYETVDQMTTVLFQRLTAKINTLIEGRLGHEVGLSTAILWNPNPWEVRQTIEIIGSADMILDLNNNEIPYEIIPSNAITTGFFSQTIRFNASLPPLGYTSLRLLNFRTSIDTGSFLNFQYTRTASNIIKSGDWEAEIDRESGFITHLRNTKSRTEFLCSGIGPVIVGDESDTWTHGLSSYRGAAHKMALESYTLVSQGRVSTEYEIVFKLFNSKVILRVILNGELGTLDIKTRVLWNEQHRLLKMSVGSAFKNETFVSEIPYGAIERKADGTEWPIQRWARLGLPKFDGDNSPCLGIINDGVYSASAESGRLDLTLLRSPVYANHENQHPRPDIQHRYIDQGESEFQIRLLPCTTGAGNDVLTRNALELNQPSLYVIEPSHDGELPPKQIYCRIREEGGIKPTVIINAIKRSEDSDGWIIRAVEAAGKNTDTEMDFEWLGVTRNFSFTPYEIKTIKITDRDKAIFETGILEY
jgi:alpha-mannosidase